MQRRQATRSFSAYTRQLEKRVIPADAILEDFRVGEGHEGLQPENRSVASFRYEGDVYFNLMGEIMDNTRVAQES